MSFVPRFKIYDSTGMSLLYTFPLVQDHNAPKSPKKSIPVTNFNASTEIILEGGNAPWDWIVEFLITGENYEEIEGALDSLNSTIEVHVPYILRIDKTISTYYEYKVKRLQEFDISKSLRNGDGVVTVVGTFRVGAW